jgi:hypothetical protein
MGIIDKQKSREQNQPSSQSEVDLGKFKDLSKQEYEKLFEALKHTWIKGEDIEIVYNAILKLQQQYILKYGG